MLAGRMCMATSQPPKMREAVESGLEPEFFVTETRMEPAGGGNIRVYCYAERHGVLQLLYTAVVPAPLLAVMGRQAMQAGADAHNLEMWEGDGTAGH